MPNGKEQIAVILKDLDRRVELVTIGLSLGIVAKLKRAASEGGTPVDTGWARANWVPQIGTPAAGTVGTRKQAEAGQVDQTGSAAGEAQLLGFKLAKGSIWITNNVRYIVRLNEGSSQQAPPGFVQAAIEEAIAEQLQRGFRAP